MTVVAETDAHEGPVYVAGEHASTSPRSRTAPRRSGASTSRRGGLRRRRRRQRRQRDDPRPRRPAARLRAGHADQPARIARSTARPASARRWSTAGAACAQLAQRRRREERRHDLVHRPQLRLPAGLPAAAAARRLRLPLRPATRRASRVVADGFDKPTALRSRPTRRCCTSATAARTRSGSSPVARTTSAFDVVDGRGSPNERAVRRHDAGLPGRHQGRRDGRVYASAFSGVAGLRPGRRPVGEIDLPGAVNFTFGGPTRRPVHHHRHGGLGRRPQRERSADAMTDRTRTDHRRRRRRRGDRRGRALRERRAATASSSPWSTRAASSIALRRTDGAQVASSRVAVDKARTAAIFVRPSREMEEQVTAAGWARWRCTAPRR